MQQIDRSTSRRLRQNRCPSPFFNPQPEVRSAWSPDSTRPPRRPDIAASTGPSSPRKPRPDPRVAARTTAPHEPSSAASSPPDGGFKAWLQVGVAFLIVLDSFGLATSFGVFQQQYARRFSASNFDVAWIGSTQLCLLFLVGSLSGRLLRPSWFYPMVVLGCVLQFGGLLAASFAQSYWQILLSHGVAVGFGNGLLFTPVVWLISSYFAERQMVALAIASTGAPVGGVVFCVMARQLMEQVALTGTLRLMGILIASNSVLIWLCSRPTKAAGDIPSMDWTAFREIPFVFFTIGMFFILAGLFVIYIFLLQIVATQLHLPPKPALTILISLHLAGIPGRFLPTLLSDHLLGALPTLVLLSAATGFSLLGLTAATSSTVAFIAFAIAYGFCANGVQSLFASGLAALTPDMGRFDARVGIVLAVVGVGCLVGSPVGGLLIDGGVSGDAKGLVDESGAQRVKVFAGMTVLGGTLCVALAGLWRRDGQGLRMFAGSATASTTTPSRHAS